MYLGSVLNVYTPDTRSPSGGTTQTFSAISDALGVALTTPGAKAMRPDGSAYSVTQFQGGFLLDNCPLNIIFGNGWLPGQQAALAAAGLTCSAGGGPTSQAAATSATSTTAAATQAATGGAQNPFGNAAPASVYITNLMNLDPVSARTLFSSYTLDQQRWLLANGYVEIVPTMGTPAPGYTAPASTPSGNPILPTGVQTPTPNQVINLPTPVWQGTPYSPTPGAPPTEAAPAAATATDMLPILGLLGAAAYLFGRKGR